MFLLHLSHGFRTILVNGGGAAHAVARLLLKRHLPFAVLSASGPVPLQWDLHK